MTGKPDPMELIRDLEKFATNPSERLLAKELRELIFSHSELKTENAKLKKDLHHYMLAANAEAQLVDDLQKENRELVRQNGGWQEKNEATEALLRQALEALEAMNPYPASREEQRATAITAIRARLNHTKEA